jgi:hypothetical protein
MPPLHHGMYYLYSHAGTLERCCGNCNLCSTVAYRQSTGRRPTLTLIWSLITDALATEINMKPSVGRLHPTDIECAKNGTTTGFSLGLPNVPTLYVGTEYKHVRPHDTMYHF